MPRRWASQASSRGVQCVIGSPSSDGFSQANETIWVSCSALNLPGEPLRSSSDNASTICVSSLSSVVSALCSASARRPLNECHR